ncbi:MAG: multidrug effflux MFS transporter [Candidatus Andeanibacterium colombiense]|uniref:Bcr/CflA family efflux transporter n=1 Tax=Candidatus Andeanibacterium colombiense TaxID=3121345 RepID=A0AAJ5X904_9SPHN|nr:MAG: multidrug effflux MFS transporter [Sphingomonadaceae bacterium]
MATVTPPAPRVLGPTELVVLTAMIMALQALAIDGMLPALPDIAGEFGVLEANKRQLIVGLFLLASGAGALVPGVLADRFGRKKLLMISLTAYVVLGFGCALAQDFEQMLVLRVLQGFATAGLMVLPGAIIRDQFEGDKMARVFSLVTAVFITVPVIAPSIGQLVLEVAGWRWIFIGLGIMGIAVMVWAGLRLPETLHPEFRQEIQPKVLVRNMYIAATSRQAVGYVLGTALVIGTVFGYVNSAQQLVGEHFGAGEYFPYVFGGTAATMAISSITNSRIVERFGARRVSHAGLLIFIVVSALQVWVAHGPHNASLLWFLPLMACNLMLLGFLGANFGSIAMQPFAEIAGAASSIQAFVRMVLAAVIGILIGQNYDGTARPLAWALLAASVLSLLLVLYSEKGKLFRRLHARPPGHAVILH